MARDAVTIQYRLHFQAEREWADTSFRCFQPACLLTEAIVRLGMGMLFWSSWQPTQETISPGIPVSQLRIHWMAAPSLSNGWMEIGVLAGMVNSAEPSSSTGTVPSIRLISHPLCIPCAS